MSKRSAKKQSMVTVTKPHQNDIEAGMQQVKKLADAVRKGFDEGYEKGRAAATEFSSYVMCPAIALALYELYGMSGRCTCKALNLAGEYMINAFTSRELIEKAYEHVGFRFEEDPLTGHMVEETNEKD